MACCPPLVEAGAPAHSCTNSLSDGRLPDGLHAVVQPPSPPPVDFDWAISYVAKIEQRFIEQPETYKAFLEVLHMYQKEKRSIEWVYDEVSQLFRCHRDLMDEFNRFMPNGSSPLQSRMVRWRRQTRLIGRLMALWRRATERVYAPGGVGCEMCRQEFAELVDVPPAASEAAASPTESLESLVGRLSSEQRAKVLIRVAASSAGGEHLVREAALAMLGRGCSSEAL